MARGESRASSVRAAGWAAFLAMLPAAAPARAADAAPAARPPAPARVDLALTISGGVSLGSYEAGFLHYALETARRNPERLSLPLATGASAGSVNALLSALASCGEPAPSLDRSLFWQVWTPAGFDRLFSPREAGRQGAFSRRWLGEVADRIQAEMARGLPESCDVVLGVAVTRLNPRVVRAAGGAIEASRTEEKFLLRLTGRGPGRMPRLANHADPRHAGEQLLLLTRPDGEVDFSTLRDLLFASSAFPVAFPPQPLAHCVVPAGAGAACPAAQARTDLFLDGGFFDNQPLRLAASVAAAGLRDDPAGGTRWLPAPDRATARLPANLAFVFLSPDAVDFPGESRRKPVGPDGSLLDVLSQVGGSFVRTARSKELYVLLEERPEVARQVVAPRRRLPAASEPLGAFLGFFETAFRTFDFTLGMYEARRMATGPSATPALARGTGRLSLPEEAAPGDPGWRPLACLRSVLDGDAAAGPACEGDGLREFRILLQVSLERLWDRCQAPDGAEHAGCAAARAGSPVPAVPGLDPSRGWRRRAGESEVEQVTRLLAEHRFRWRDLGLGPGEAGSALRAVRRRLGDAGEALAAAQPPGERELVGEASRLAANTLLYLPPRAAGWVAGGGAFELGVEVGFGDGPAGWLRLQAALDVHGLSDFASSEPSAFALTPMVGLAAMPPGLSGAVVQWSFFLRAGYLFSERDSWGSGGCTDEEAARLGACSRATFQAGAAATLLDLVRLQLAGEVYPPLRPGLKTLWALSPVIGVQLRF